MSTPPPYGADSPDPAPTDTPRRGGRLQQWWLVTCLTILAMLAMIDKNVLTLLVGAIKADLALTDTQMGVIVGLAFALANFSISVPAGWLADRFSRRAVIAAGVGFWSVMAAACGAANSFLHLFLARAGVGLGEGLIPPPSYSLIRDGVDPPIRGRAFAVYGMAASVGTGLSLVLGGALVGAIAASGVDRLPVLGPARPWQIALVMIGLLGLPLALLAYAFRDPGRPPVDAAVSTSFADAWRHARRCRGALVMLMLFSVCHAMIAGSISSWLPAILGREFGLQPQQVGPVLGIMLIVCAPIGLGAAGYLMDRSRRNGPAGAALSAIAASVVLLGAGAFVTRSDTLNQLWVLQVFVLLSSTVYLPVTSTLVAQLMPAHTIGKTMSVFLVAQGVLGSGFSPVIAAGVSDMLFPGEPGGLGRAIALVVVIYGTVALASAIALWAILRTPSRKEAAL